MSNAVLSIRNLSKDYILRSAERQITLTEAVLQSVRSRGRANREVLHAVKDMSFDVSAGEAVALIGPNGSGKSTTLKLINRVTHPTRGEIRIRGRIGSLLEVGTGFHPELTGQENIYLNVSILGMTKREVDTCFDDIVEFSGVARFLNTPVKRYSSGMYVRLAFAVASHLPSEILLIDEVLAVGDAEFKSRSLAKMKSMVNDGRTILFVSHHMPSVAELCSRGVCISKGSLVFDGKANDAVQHYHSLVSKSDITSTESQKRRPGSGAHRLTQFIPLTPSFSVGEPKRFRFMTQCFVDVGNRFGLSTAIRNENGDLLAHCDSKLMGVWLEGDRDHVGEFEFRHPWLQPGRYSVSVDVHGHELLDQVEPACYFDVIPDYPYPMPVSEWSAVGRVLGDFDWRVADQAPLESPA